MKPDEMPQFFTTLLTLAEAYGLEFPEARQVIYFKALEDLPLKTLESAIWWIIKNRTFAGNLPTVAEIREAAGNGPEPIETRIAIAWDKLLYGLRNYGYYYTVIFVEEPIIHQIIDAWGGWMGDWTDVKSENLKWLRKDFEALYRAYIHLDLPSPKPLIGYHEQHNSQTGWDNQIPAPIYITGLVGEIKGLTYNPDMLVIQEAK